MQFPIFSRSTDHNQILVAAIAVRAGRDGRKEGFEQVLPAGLRSGEDTQKEAAQKPTNESANDAPHEHSLQHLWELHLQGHKVQFPQGRCHW